MNTEQRQLDWPSIEEQMAYWDEDKRAYWEKRDVGGNVIPDRIQTNREQYDDARLEARIEAQEEYEDQQEAWSDE